MEINESHADLDLDGFKNWMRQSQASDETTRVYSVCLRRWHRHLRASGQSPIQAWNEWDDVTAQVRRLSGYALKRYRAYQLEKGDWAKDLGTPVRLPRSSRPNPSPVTNEQLHRLRQAMRKGFPTETSITLRVWVTVLNELGIRRGETPMSWEAFDFDATTPTVEVRGKTGERTLPIPPRLHRLLKWLLRRRNEAPWLGARNQCLSVGTLYQLFKKAARLASAPQLRPHHFRHTFLTRLCRSQLGQNQLLVLAIAGHSHVSSLQHYYRVSTEEMAQVLLAA